MLMHTRGMKRFFLGFLVAIFIGATAMLVFLNQVHALSTLQGVQIMLNACGQPIPTYNVGAPTAEGPGTITKSPTSAYLPEQADITLTATPSASSDPDIEAEFVRWENLNIYAVGTNQTRTQNPIIYKNGGHHIPKAIFRWVYKVHFSVPTGHGHIDVTGYQQYIYIADVFSRIPGGSTFTVTAVPDAGYEFDFWEMFWSIGYGGTSTSTTNPITFPDTGRAFSMAAHFALPLRVNFGNAGSSIQEGASTAHLPVTLSRNTLQTVTVYYSFSGTANGRTDYDNGDDGGFLGAHTELTFEPGETSKTIDIPIFEDTIPESDETVIVTLTGISTGSIGTDAVHTLFITDNDTLPQLSFQAATSSVSENAGTASIVATLSAPCGQTITASYAVTGGTATSGGVDYTLTDGTLTFAPNETTKTLSVPIVDDLLFESDETILISLFNPQNAAQREPSQHTLTITENDARPSVAFETATAEGSENAGIAHLNVVLSNPSSETITVAYAAAGGTAQGGGVDYLLTPGTLTFAPGETTKTIAVSLVNDQVLDPNETVMVTLSDPQNATLGATATETLTITDNDKTLTVAVTGEGTVAPANGVFDTDSTVSVQATPSTGWRFDHWTGDVTGTTNPVSVTFDTNKTVTAVFVSLQHTLTTSSQGSGTVTPASGAVDIGTTAQITATPATGWRFDHWTGDASGNANPVSVLMDGNKTVTAVFVETPTLTTLAQGSGTVTPSSVTLDKGSTVQVSATASEGWQFDHWTGDAYGSENPITVTLSSNKTVTAVFIQPVTLAVVVQGTGTVTPTSGIYARDTQLSLQATAGTGYRFDHWEGAATGNINPVLVAMNGDKTVTAVFVPIVQLVVTNQGQGTVSLNPPGCIYDVNTVVTLTAAASTGWGFSHWEGDLTGNQNPASVTMDTAKTVTAVFQPTYTLTTAVRKNETTEAVGGTVTVSPSGTQQIQGSQVTATAVPSAGYYFVAWEGGITSNQNPLVFTMNGNTSITAVFAPGYTLTITTDGQGTVTPGSQVVEADSQIEVTATPATDWVFQGWDGDECSTENPIVVTMDRGKRLTATFVYRPNATAFDFESDLNQFLVDIGVLTGAVTDDIFAFDTGDLAYVTDPTGVTINKVKMLAANGIPDVAELRLLQTVLQQATYNESVGGGCSNDLAWRSWQKNLLQAQTDLLAPIPTYLARLTAAYMTLGTPGHREAITKLLLEHYNVTLSATGYDTQGARYFDKNGDVDNDGVWNREEWDAALAAQEEPYVGVICAATVNTFVQMAMDASLPETSESNGPFIYHGTDIYDENGVVFVTADDVVQFGSAQHMAVLAEATGANLAYLPKTSLTLGTTTGPDLKYDANVVDPPGFENVPLTKGQASTFAKGRQIRVTLKGTKREKKWFKKWYAPNTLVDGMPNRSVTMRLGNDEQTVAPVKRSVGCTYLENVTWTANGYQPEEAYEGVEDNIKYVYAPEDTYVTLSYDEASSGSGTKSGAGETCKRLGWYIGRDGQINSSLFSTGSIQLALSFGDVVWPEILCCANEPPDPEYGDWLSYNFCWDTLDGKWELPTTWFHKIKGDSGCTTLVSAASGGFASPGGVLALAPYAPPNDVLYSDWVICYVLLKPGYQYEGISSSSTTATLVLTSQGINVTSATGPVNAQVTTAQMMTLDADVEVEGGNVPPALSGVIKNADSSSISGFYTRISDPDAPLRPHPNTELIGLQVEVFSGFNLKRWTGTCPVFDEHGVLRTDVALDAREDEPARWVTDQTIYVKCADLQSGTLVAASPKVRAVLEQYPMVTLKQGDREIRFVQEDQDRDGIPDDVATISATPEMPTLEATYIGSGSPPVWRLEVYYEGGIRGDNSEHFPIETVSGTRKYTDTPSISWQVDWGGHICGGVATLYCKRDGRENTFKFRVLGYNALQKIVRERLGNLRSQLICWQESRFQQFTAQTAFWLSWNTKPETVNRAKDNGFGLMQITGCEPVTNAILWDWRENINAGKRFICSCAENAGIYVYQVRTGANWTKETGGEPENQGTAYPDATAFTEEQLNMEVWSRYNSNKRYYDWKPATTNPNNPGEWIQRTKETPNRTGTDYANTIHGYAVKISNGEYPPLWGEN